MKLTSRERILGVIEGKKVDHIPLYSWVFGFNPPEYLRWKRNGREVEYWYTLRMEHIHTIPEQWDIYDDFNRVNAWLNLGCDDMLDVSIPWSIHKDVSIKDWQEKDIFCREYITPAGNLLQKIRKTDEYIPAGWVIQSDKPKLFEDLNLPRSVKSPVEKEEDIEKLKYVLSEPTKEQIENYKERISLIKKFSKDNGVLVQGWPIFGMDGVIWLCGIEKSIISAMTEPEFFQRLVDSIYEFDLIRTKMMIDIGGIDIIVQRGWYSSTDFWSPKLFYKYVLPNIKRMAELIHQANLKYAYTMTTGVINFLEDLENAGVDLLYFIDPEQDKINLNEVKEKLRGNITVAGGINSSISLMKGNSEEIRHIVHNTINILRNKKFILSPVDALFPDTPWENVKTMIDVWKEIYE